VDTQAAAAVIFEIMESQSNHGLCQCLTVNVQTFNANNFRLNIAKCRDMIVARRSCLDIPARRTPFFELILCARLEPPLGTISVLLSMLPIFARSALVLFMPCVSSVRTVFHAWHNLWSLRP
jgi:hypothetical protein